jgi:DNA-binding transcriptional LysR family regulator
MTLDQLASFRAVARHRGFGRAAAHVHLTQPAISKQIRALEEELGLRLFDRGRHVELTVAGEALLAHVEQMFRLLDTARAEVAGLVHASRERLGVGASPSLAMEVLPGLLERYRALYPDVALTIRTAWAPDVITQVSNGELDLGLVLLTEPGPRLPAGLIALPLEESDLAFVRAAGDRRIRGRRVTVEALADIPWVLNQDGCQFRRLLQRRFNRRGVALKIAFEVTGIEVQKRLVQAGLAVTVLPRALVADELRAGTLREFVIEGITSKSTSFVIHGRAKRLKPPARGFLDLLGKMQ